MTQIDLEQRRAAAIAGVDGLGRSRRRDLNDIVQLVAAVCQAPAALTIITATEQHSVVTSTGAPSVMARGEALCARVLDRAELVVVEDASSDPRLADSPEVDGRRGRVRFFASAPLVVPDGSGGSSVIGRLSVADVQPRDLDDTGRQALRTLAARAADVLELERRRRDERESAAAALAEPADEHLRAVEFAGQMAHDLQIPLGAAARHTAELGRMPALANDLSVQRHLRGTLRALRRAELVADAVVGHARAHGDVRPEHVDLEDLVGRVLGDLAAVIEDAGADVVVKDLPVVYADPVATYSVLLNLLSNAVAHARPGVPPFVAVTSDRVGDHWCIYVTDNGVGVSQAEQQLIFEPFARGTTGSAGGAGLGLATARRVVERHGGRIGCTAGQAGGSEFWFELPAWLPTAPQLPPIRVVSGRSSESSSGRAHGGRD